MIIHNYTNMNIPKQTNIVLRNFQLLKYRYTNTQIYKYALQFWYCTTKTGSRYVQKNTNNKKKVEPKFLQPEAYAYASLKLCEFIFRALNRWKSFCKYSAPKISGMVFMVSVLVYWFLGQCIIGFWGGIFGIWGGVFIVLLVGKVSFEYIMNILNIFYARK